VGISDSVAYSGPTEKDRLPLLLVLVVVVLLVVVAAGENPFDAGK